MSQTVEPGLGPTETPQWLRSLQKRVQAIAIRFRTLSLVGAGFLAALLAVFLYDIATPSPHIPTPREVQRVAEQVVQSAPARPAFASIAYANIRPSLVQIEAGSSLGGGVVVDDTGLILTCLHVIEEGGDIQITFADGFESIADIVTVQPENDLAVLQAREIPDDLAPATLSSASNLRVGDEVVAVGNPFGIRDSVSSGVVSGLRRSYNWSERGVTLNDLIQFDAAVNPGNSGGPLLDRNGEVVGIVTSLLNPNEEQVFIGIGFAVTIDTAAAAAGPPEW